MFVTRVVTPNIFEPYEREVETVMFVGDGPTLLRDSLPEDWSAPEDETVAFVNGVRCDEWERELEEGEIVHFIAGISDPVSIVMVVVAVVSAVGAIVALNSLPETPPTPNPDGSSTYGYFGFQNAFRAEGDPLPVVYGRIRVAPPIINQIIVSTGASQFLGVARREAMNLLLAISEGPIYGLGDFVGEVSDDEDLEALTLLAGSTKGGTGLEINGISAQNFVGDIAWRTGTLTQDEISGAFGFAGLNEVSATYALDITPPNGTEDINETAHPSGVYPPGDANLIDEPNEEEYVAQNILVKSDKAIVQIDFKRGLWKQNTSTGGLDPQSTIVRIQYRETDSGGVATGDYVLLPQFRIIGSSNAPLSVDIPINFADPSSFAASTPTGAARMLSSSGYFLSNSSTTGHTLMQPAAAGIQTQRFTMGCWVYPSTWATSSGMSKWIFFATDSGVTYNSYGSSPSGNLRGPRPNLSTIMGGSGWSLRLFQNIDSAFGLPSNAVLAVLDSWHAGDITSPVGGGHSMWWAQIGTTDEFAATEWMHLAVRFIGSSSTGNVAVRFTVNGVNHFTAQERNIGQPLSTAIYAPRWQANGDWYLGSFNGLTTTTDEQETNARLGQWFIYDGLLSDDNLAELGSPFIGVDTSGNKLFGLEEVLVNDPLLTVALPMETQQFVGADRVTPNILYGTEEGEDYGDFKLSNSAVISTAVNGPIYDSAQSDPKLSYWLVEVYVGPQINESNENNEATVSSIVALTNQTYRYPSTAVASVSIQADDQVNNQQPGVTVLVKGKLVKTWDGTYDNDGNPVYLEAWSRNPAWIAADLLTSKVYGLGNDVPGSDAIGSIDWPSFLEWARYCDEGTADAFGKVKFFGLTSDPADDYIQLYVGLRTTGGASAETIPESWRPRNVTTGEYQSFLSTTDLTAGGISSEWITANDSATGLNASSNLLGIVSIEYFNSSAGFHGYEDYARITIIWNRDSRPDPGVVSYYADDLGISELGQVSGFEERCRFDGVFDQKDQSGWEAVLQIFQAGRAMPIKAGRKVYAIVDKPRPVVAVFGQGNVVTDTLEVTYRGPFASPNSLEGDILDELNNYQRRTILVDHPSIQDPTLFDSFRKERVDLRGVTRVSQAIRDCNYRLNRYYLLRRSVKFEVGPDAVNLLPGDRFRLSHDVPQYGFSGRLRADATVYNFYPRQGSLYAAWDKQGGPSSASRWALFSEDTVTSSPITSDIKVVEMLSLPATSDSAGPAASQGLSGSDTSPAATPFYNAQHIATANTLYPPTEVFGPLTQIQELPYEACFSIYAKEPTLGACEYIELSIYRYCDSEGTLIEQSNTATFRWISGALTTAGTSTGIVSSVSSVGSGWYRINIGYDTSGAAPGDVGDYLQARVALFGIGGSWLPVADGGKGTNFLEFGDPLDISNITTGATFDGTKWYRPAVTDAPSTISIRPPFYTVTDGSYGNTVRLSATNSSGTKYASHIGQKVTLTTGSGVSSWNGETINFTGYARLDTTNTATTTDLYIDIRFEDSRNATTKVLDGDGIRATLRYSGGSWAFVGTPAKVQVNGTIANEANAVAAVRQTSTTNDSNWVQFDVSCDYTPTSGSVTEVFCELACYNAAYTTTAAADVWGLRVHGKSSLAVVVNPHYHRRMLFWGAMYEEDVSVPSTYRDGSGIQLDRDVTLEAGKQYEVLIRSSFSPDSVLGIDNSEVVAVDAEQVPGSGSSTVAANSRLYVATARKFTPHEGDLYSFGEVGKASDDFVVTRISLDPGTMHREIEAEEYDETVFEDTILGDLGEGTISALPDPSASVQSSVFGVGLNSDGYGLRGFEFQVREETIGDERGGGQPRLFISWNWPSGVRVPRRMHLYLAEEIAGENPMTWPIYRIGTCDVSEGGYQYDGPLLKRGTSYRVTFQPEGSSGAAMPLETCPYRYVSLRKVVNPAILAAPVVTTATRGFQQLYELKRVRNSRLVEIVEGRIGGWKMGTPAFVIDPDVANTASDSTLVGQLSTSSGKVNMQVICRGRTDLGHYGQASELFGTEQLKDVSYANSTATDNDYANFGAADINLTTGSVMQFTSSSSALTATYLPDEIDLGTAKRVLVNFTVEATQVRPETLGDLPYALNSETIRRWSLEGPMDDLDGDDAELVLEWKWSSTASTGSDTYRVFRPGEVYARKLTFRVTFKRPTTDYNIRMTRCLVQALEIPEFKPGDIDGGTFA
jgi:hypothetical protein